MERFIFSWKSEIMIEEPWRMPVFLFMLGLILSTFTWIFQNKRKKN